MPSSEYPPQLLSVCHKPAPRAKKQGCRDPFSCHGTAETAPTLARGLILLGLDEKLDRSAQTAGVVSLPRPGDDDGGLFAGGGGVGAKRVQTEARFYFGVD